MIVREINIYISDSHGPFYLSVAPPLAVHAVDLALQRHVRQDAPPRGVRQRVAALRVAARRPILQRVVVVAACRAGWMRV